MVQDSSSDKSDAIESPQGPGAVKLDGEQQVTISLRDDKDLRQWLEDLGCEMLVGDGQSISLQHIKTTHKHLIDEAWSKLQSREITVFAFRAVIHKKWNKEIGSKRRTYGPDGRMPGDTGTKAVGSEQPPDKKDNVFGIEPAATQQPHDETGKAQTADLNLTFSHTGGDLLAPQSVTISCPPKGAEIHYTTDDTEPVLKSPKYKSPVLVDRSIILRAKAFLNGQSGVEAKAQYNLSVATVEFVRESGDYNPPVTVAIKCKSPGATIRYTLDGSEPSESSDTYSEPFNITSSCTVKARSYKSGLAPSEVNSVTYNIKAAEWRELEPADKTDEPVDHVAKERIDHSNGWSAIVASARGKLHAHNGTWRDDSFKLATEGPWTIIAVADGMGSAPKSRVGSKAACDAAVAYLLTELHGYTLQAPSKPESSPEQIDLEKVSNRLVECARRAKGAIERVAADRKLEPKLFATTLLVCIHCQWGDSDFAAAIQVGDGCIATLRDQDGTAVLLTEADHGEFSSQTRPITEKNIEREFASRIKASVKRLRCIAIMTDGISDDFFPEDKRIVELFTGTQIAGMTAKDGKPVDGILKSVLNKPMPEEALLDWMTYDKKQSADDRTLALLFRRDV